MARPEQDWCFGIDVLEVVVNCQCSYCLLVCSGLFPVMCCKIVGCSSHIHLLVLSIMNNELVQAPQPIA